MKLSTIFAAAFLSILHHGSYAVDEGSKTVDNVGVYVYKSDKPFYSHIRHFIELNNGAHYYVQNYYDTDYSNAIGTIELPTGNDLNLQGRVACLSLSVMGGAGAVDIGVENAGSGWFPYYYAGYVNEGHNPGRTYPNAAKVFFSIDALNSGSSDRVSGQFIFYDASGSEIATETLVFAKPKGDFFHTSGGKPLLRFLRFMSLLPGNGANLAEYDVPDGSYMRNPKFTGLQLYHRENGYQKWNMNQIEHAWSVQTANIEDLQISPSALTSIRLVRLFTVSSTSTRTRTWKC